MQLWNSLEKVHPVNSSSRDMHKYTTVEEASSSYFQLWARWRSPQVRKSFLKETDTQARSYRPKIEKSIENDL